MAEADTRQKPVPRVSIGMPVYNGGPFIRKAIDSLLAQSFGDFELIISDNCSTDSTEAICQEYAFRDPRIRYIRQTSNRGSLANFYFVLDEAVGEYFMWAAADDCWDHNWVETLIGDFVPGTMLAFGHVTSIDENDAVVEQYRYRTFSKIPLVWKIQYFLQEEFYFKANYVYGLYKRRELLSCRFRDVYGSDNILVFEIIQRGRLSTNPNTLLYKRVYAGSAAMAASEASSGLLRKLFLLDLLPYYMAFPGTAHGHVLKALLLILLPVKYLKSFCFNLARAAQRRLHRWLPAYC